MASWLSDKLGQPFGNRHHGGDGGGGGEYPPPGHEFHHHPHPPGGAFGFGQVVPGDFFRDGASAVAPGTYPRLAHLSDGSLLMGFTTFGPAPDERALEVWRSHDGGRSFAPHGTVTRCRGTDCDNLVLLEVPPSYLPGDEGRELSLRATGPIVLAAFRNHDLDGHGRPTFFRITVCRSLDGGRTWAFLSQAREQAAHGGGGLWEPFLRLGRDGRSVHATFSAEVPGDGSDQNTMLAVSEDGGARWSAPRCVTGGNERLRDGMTGVARTWDRGRAREALVLTLETTRAGVFSVECLLSYDDGESWGDRQVVHAAPAGHNAGAPAVASFRDGALAVAFMTDEDCAPHEQDWPRRAAVKVVFSPPPSHGRLAFGPPHTVHTEPAAWPSVTGLDDWSALVAYETRGRINGRLLTWRPAEY